LSYRSVATRGQVAAGGRQRLECLPLGNPTRGRPCRCCGGAVGFCLRVSKRWSCLGGWLFAFLALSSPTSSTDGRRARPRARTSPPQLPRSSYSSRRR